MQTARQQLLYLNAVMESFGRTAQSGAKLGEELLRGDFVETFQKMWRRHFNSKLFGGAETSQILLYNLLVALQVK